MEEDVGEVKAVGAEQGVGGDQREPRGRSRPRHPLYMAALSAVRCEPAYQARYQRLIRGGKPHKVAIVAVMRALACLLNTLLRQNCLWQAEPSDRALEAAA